MVDRLNGTNDRKLPRFKNQVFWKNFLEYTARGHNLNFYVATQVFFLSAQPHLNKVQFFPVPSI